jgi:asparagine synthase (glutamine-hydrolysing)
MCGIAGVFSCKAKRAAVEAMTDFLAHRGPDDAGIAELHDKSGRSCAVFGHRRLAILDLSSAGHQPMFSPDKRYCMTFNGEIYNYESLRAELQSQGVCFIGHSDTEVLIHGWALHGVEFLRKLRGMFALAIWDRDENRGLLIRDPFGIKPLYMAERDGEVFFASEVKALLETGVIARRLSPTAVRSYLATGSVAEPYTIIEGVTAIPPGCVIEVKRDGDTFATGTAVRFGSVVFERAAEQRHERSHIHRIRNALRESVRYHLVSDVPVGVFLSGGIDSSAIAGLASEVSGNQIESFTVTFAETDYSEAGPAREAARRFNLRHHEIPLSGENLLASLPEVFEAMDQPSLDGLNTFVVSGAVRSLGLKVVLSGLGGDELFGGYPSFQRAHYVAPLWKLPRTLRRAGVIGAAPFDDVRLARIGAVLNDPTPSQAAYRASRTLFGDRQIARMTATNEASAFSHGADEGADAERLSLMQQVSLYETTGYMRNTLLRDSDVFSMAHGLELRVPFVDLHVAQVAMEAAEELDLGKRGAKPLLVEAVRDLLSEESVRHPKRGFTLPFEKWMRDELFSEVNSVLEGDGVAEIGIDQKEVSDVWSHYQRRKPGVNWSRPWALYTLVRWAQVNRIEGIAECSPSRC